MSTRDRAWWKRRLWLLGGLLGLYSLYFPIGLVTHGMTGHVPAIGLDHATPLLPHWVHIYGLIIPIAYLPAFVIQHEGLFRRTALAYLTTEIVAFTIFLTYPVHMALRPEAPPVTDFSTWGIGLCYWLDTPSNCLPSLHVAGSVLGALCCFRADRWIGGVAIVAALLIGPSTMLVKQHLAADVVTGLALAIVTYLAFVHRLDLSDVPHARRRCPRRWSLWLVGGYALFYIVLYGLYVSGLAPWATTGA